MGYATKIAVKTDSAGSIHRVYFSADLPEYKLKLGNIEIPGFVLRYEKETLLLKGKGIDVTTAVDIDFYEGFLGFPNEYPIRKISKKYH